MNSDIATNRIAVFESHAFPITLPVTNKISLADHRNVGEEGSKDRRIEGE